MKPHSAKAKARKPSPSRLPKKIDHTAWWYEDGRGIQIVYQIYHEGAYVRTDMKRIPWGKIVKAAQRCRCLSLTPSKTKEKR